MKNKSIFIFSMFLLVLTFSFVSSAQITQINNGPEGLQIFYPTFDFVKQSSEFRLHLHVSNLSNGFPYTNDVVDCKLHLYNSTGQHTFESGILNKDSNGYDHEIFLNSDGGNFSDLGTHAFYIWCNTTDLGGEAKGTFEVTPSGEELTQSNSLLLIAALIILLTLIVLTIRGMVMVDNFGWNFGFLNIAYLLFNIFFFVGWKIFSLFITSIPSIGTALHSLWIVSNIVWIPFILGQVAFLLLKATDEAHITSLMKKGYTQDEAQTRVKRKK